MAYQKKTDRKLLATFLTSAMVATAVAPAASLAAEDFPDVPADHEAAAAISKLVEAGVIDGYPDDSFKPGNSGTRAEVSKIISTLLKLQSDAPDAGFTDVSDAWYTPHINVLHAAGHINGYGDGTFKPNENISRAEFAKIVVEAYGLEIVSSDLPFDDVKDDAWYSPYIETLYANGLIKGQTATTFGPSNDLKRIDLALLISNADDFSNQNFKLSIMHTNDTHGNLDNVAKTTSAVKKVRAGKPDSLLLSAGDVFSGTLYFNTFQGQADLEFMNLMKYDMMTFGNHEFDLGSSEEGHQALVDFIEGAQFPFVSSNVDFSADDKFAGLFSDVNSSDPENGKIYNGIIKEVDGEKIGIFGLTTAETADISSPENVKFENYLEEAKKAVAAFEDQGVNKIVALTHIGYDDNAAYDNDLTLATEVDGIDVIVGGHSHSSLEEPAVIDEDTAGEAKDPTVIVQANEYNNFLGTLDVQFDEDGKVVGYAGELIEITDQPDDAEAAALLEPYASEIEEVRNEPIGAVAESALENPRTEGDNTLPSVRKNETPLGNLITDGMLAKARQYNDKVIMSLQNGGGIRAPIDAGPITVGEVMTTLPFMNLLATMELSGVEIREAFEHSVRAYPTENGGFLHVSGAQVKFDSSQPEGERVVSIAYANEDGTYTEIEDGEMYHIATNAFTAKGGDGYDVFAKAFEEDRVQELGFSDWAMFADHLATLGTIKPTVEGRILEGDDFEAPTNGGNTGGSDAPKSTEVDLTGLNDFSNESYSGDLILTGTPDEDITFTNVSVKGNLDVSGMTGANFNFENIEVEGDTIL